MKYSIKITGIAVMTFISVSLTHAQDASSRGMSGPATDPGTMMGGPYGPGSGPGTGPGTGPGSSPYGPGAMMGGGGHRSFKIADINLDEVNEIVFLQGSTLTVMDNTGKTLFTKTVDGLYAAPWYYQENNSDDNQDIADRRHHGGGWGLGGGHHGGGMGFGNGWWPWRQSGDSTVNYQVYSMRGTGSNLEVANMNDDPYPEIIIEAYTKLIVLDHNGDPETTIDLPLTNAYPWQ